MRRVFNSQTPARWTRAPVTAVLAGLGTFQALLWFLLWSLDKIGCAQAAGPLNAKLWRSQLELVWDGWEAGQWWRLFTFPLAGDSWAGLWTLPLLLLLGRALEPILGGFRFGALLLLGPIAGGMAELVLESLSLPGVPKRPLFGWACDAFALLGAYGAVLPDWPVGAAARWQLPGLRARHIPRLALAAALLSALTGVGDSCAPAALAASCALGWRMPHWFGFGEIPSSSLRWGFSPSQNHRLESMPWSEFVEHELDPVLEKIARHGLQSLTKSERRILKTGQRRLERGPDP